MFEPIEDEHGAGALRQGGEGREKCRHLLAAGGDAVRIEDIEVPFRFGKRGFAIALADHELADAIYQQILCDAKNIDIGLIRRSFPDQQSGEHRSEEHTSELQSLMRISYAVFCLKKKNTST